MTRGVEIAFGCYGAQKLLLDFCWADGSEGSCSSSSSPSLWSIIIIVVRIGSACMVLELCEEKVVAPGGVTNALDGRCAIVTTELLLSLFPDFGIRKLCASPTWIKIRIGISEHVYILTYTSH